MRITELLCASSIALNTHPANKAEAIDTLAALMNKAGKLNDLDAYKKEVWKREEESTTGIGDGVAIPHARSKAVKKPGLAAITVSEGVEYESLDGKPAHLLFMIAAPEEGGNLHLQALAKLSGMLMDETFRQQLLQAQTPEEFLSCIDRREKLADEKNSAKQTAGGYRVLAITACPTGVAHTYMAAEALEETGRKIGIPVKVETQGAEGTANALSRDEITKADGIIIAADKNVDLSRFHGKPVVIVKVADGISKPEQLIRQAAAKDAPIYEGGSEQVQEESTGESFGRKIYKDLMNGVSHMLPFVIGGGILIALAFLLDDFSIDPSNFGKNTPIAAYLKTIGEFSFGMMLPVLSGYIAMSIADRPGLAVGFVAGLVAKAGSTFLNPAGGEVNAGFLGALFAGFAAGYLVKLLEKATKKMPQSLNSLRPMMIYPVFGILLGAMVTTLINPVVGAINTALNNFLISMNGTSRILLGMIVGGMQSTDMGGPINKASYVFATSQLAEGNFEIMAAVMAGGMVPPLVIALCTTLFKNRFTQKERNSGLVNYLLGLSFISEGAIPFAAADPLRVIASCICGSAIAGGLSMFFGCMLRAPHGGVFVLPTITNPFMYLAAILIGSIAGALLLGFLKKPLPASQSGLKAKAGKDSQEKPVLAAERS